MKTSNKILLTFFLCVFMAPVILALTFKEKRDKGEYAPLFKTLKKFSVIKIEGDAMEKDRLTCNFIQSDSLGYKYFKGDSSWLALEQKGDTLLVSYADKSGRKNGYSREINIYVPNLGNEVIVDYARVSYSMPKANSVLENASFVMGKESGLRLGQSYAVDYDEQNNGINESPDALKSASVATINKLVIKGEDIKASVHGRMQLKDATFELKGKSTLLVMNKVGVEKVSATLTDSCTVNGSWPVLRAIARASNQ